LILVDIQSAWSVFVFSQSIDLLAIDPMRIMVRMRDLPALLLESVHSLFLT